MNLFLDDATRIWNAPGFSAPLNGDKADYAQGPVVMVAYVAREGHELPAPE